MKKCRCECGKSACRPSRPLCRASRPEPCRCDGQPYKYKSKAVPPHRKGCKGCQHHRDYQSHMWGLLDEKVRVAR